MLSCAEIVQAETWWNKGFQGDVQVASIINQASNPLLISNGLRRSEARQISLSYLLKPEVKFLLVAESNISKVQIPQGFSNIFVYTASESLLQRLEQTLGYELKLVYAVESPGKSPVHFQLWRLEK